MSGALVADRVDLVVLARLAAAPAPRAAALVEALRRFVPAASDADVAATLGRLRERGCVAGGAGADERGLTVTTSGASALAGVVTTRAAWALVADRALPMYALGWDSGDRRVRARLGKRLSWAAAIVARQLGVGDGAAPPTPPAVANAVVWHALGLGGAPARAIPAAIRARLLGALAGAEVGNDWERALVLAAARAVGSPRAELRALRDGVVRAWLGGRAWTTPVLTPPTWAATATPSLPPTTAPATTTTTPPLPAIAPPRGDDLALFARRVHDAAQHARAGTFGDRKVFISAVWRHLGSDDAGSLDDFKRRLVEANQRGLVRLHRADLVAEMDPVEVAASATRYLDATFHFVERELVP